VPIPTDLPYIEPFADTIIMNEELQKVTRWLIDIQIKDAKIQCVESIKYLGVMLDNKMNFKNNALTAYVRKLLKKLVIWPGWETN
jgi:hypothetical protein